MYTIIQVYLLIFVKLFIRAYLKMLNRVELRLLHTTFGTITQINAENIW